MDSATAVQVRADAVYGLLNVIRRNQSPNHYDWSSSSSPISLTYFQLFKDQCHNHLIQHFKYRSFLTKKETNCNVAGDGAIASDFGLKHSVINNRTSLL